MCRAAESIGITEVNQKQRFVLRIHNYLRIENAGRLCFDRCVFIYLYACYSQNSKSIEPNRMEFGVMIGYYPGTS